MLFQRPKHTTFLVLKVIQSKFTRLIGKFDVFIKEF